MLHRPNRFGLCRKVRKGRFDPSSINTWHSYLKFYTELGTVLLLFTKKTNIKLQRFEWEI